MDRTSLLDRESGRIAIAVPCQDLSIRLGPKDISADYTAYFAPPNDVSGRTQSIYLRIALTGPYKGSGQPNVQVARSTQLFLGVFCFSDLCLLTRIRNGFQESICAVRSRRFAGKDAAEHHVPAVNSVSGVVILLDHCTF